jgi:uncharacterized damage-inducible protein DinB
MIPPRIMDTFASVPAELVGLCRPHPWDDLTRSPADGMRSIRDVLAHVIGAEAFWIHHVALRSRAFERAKFAPAAFAALDAILSAWTPQRAATLKFFEQLTPDQRVSRRAFPWDQTQAASVDEITWHVITHEQYHRGQIFTRLALLGRRDLPDYDLLR